MPAQSNYRIRYLRPDGTLRYDSGAIGFQGGNNPFFKWSYWWWNYNINFDVTGTWTLEFSVNGVVTVKTPITITAGAILNRPPVDVTASFDPPVGYASQAMFCRVPFHLIDDPDYNVVRYRFLWRRNGVDIRASTNAGLADALAAGTCSPGDVLTCTVTPFDGVIDANSVIVTTTLRQTYSEWAAEQNIPGALPTDDADHDGLANIVEYVFDLSPTTAGSLPLPTRDPATGAMNWQLIPNPALDPLVTYFAETSPDLIGWSPATLNSATDTWSAGDLTDKQRFMRLQISR